MTFSRTFNPPFSPPQPSFERLIFFFSDLPVSSSWGPLSPCDTEPHNSFHYFRLKRPIFHPRKRLGATKKWG